MNRIEATELANSLLKTMREDQNTGRTLWDAGWRFRINNRAKRVAGYCKHSQKIVELSGWCLNGGKTDPDDTIRHEVAHAMVPPYKVNGRWQHHCSKWKRMCLLTGANPTRCYTKEQVNRKPEYKYVLHCACQEHGYHRRSRAVENPELFHCTKCKHTLAHRKEDSKPSKKNRPEKIDLSGLFKF